ncbi:MAG: hypothetical protein ACLQGT_12955 [Terracidiphilus sp.]
MNEKSQLDSDRKILSSVKREMAMPRLTASVRKALEAEAALAARALVAPAVRAGSA